MATVDSLDIQISAQASKASSSLDNLVSKLNTLSTSLSRINGSGLTGLANGVNKLSTAMQGIKTVGTADFTRLAKNIEKLGNINTSNLNSAASSMSQLTRAFNQLGGVSANAQQVGELASNLSKLGYKSINNAIANLPALTSGLNNLMTTLSKAPSVSNNVIQMTNALANLASQGGKVGATSNTLVNGLNRSTSAMNRAAKSSKSLAAAFGKFYATWFLVIRGVKKLWSSIKSSMNYIEVLNYFDAAFTQVAEKADLSSWQELGYASAEEYANSFAERAKELTSKMTGFEISPTGTLEATGIPSLGLDPSQLMNYQAMFGQMASSMGVTSETAVKLSSALSMIGADLASVKNMDFDKVWTDMASGLAGMSRTLDKYGVNIRNVNLQQKLTELGIDANITALNQNDKALLRTIILLDSTRYAWGDLADTINQPANQLRLITANFQNLARTIGNLFLPIVQKVLPYINALVIALQRLFSWIGNLLGVDLSKISNAQKTNENLESIYDSIEDVADGYDDAKEAAKEYENQLLGFDEITKLQEPKDTDSSDSTDGGLSSGLLDAAFEDALSEYQKVWDEAFANMENRSQEMADKITGYFTKIYDAAEPLRKSIKKLWNEGFKELGDFKSKALKDFYNEFLKPIGKWTLGKGLPMLVDSINELLKKINWNRINNNLKKFWSILEPFTEGIGEGLINFFDKYSKLSATLINSVSFAVEKVLDLVGLVPTSVVKAFGKGLGELLGVFLLFKSLIGVSAIITKIGTAFSGMFAIILAHPIAATTAVIAAFTAEVYNFFAHPIELGISTNVAKKFSDISESVKTAIDNVTSSINNYEESTKNTEAKFNYIETVAGKYIELSQNYVNLTDEQKQLLKSYADILKENVEGVEEYINPITGAYQGTTDKLNELIEDTRRYYLVLGAKEKITEFGVQLAELSINISDATKKLNDAINDTTIDAWGNKTQSYLDWASRAYQANDNMYDSITGVKDSYRVLINALEDANYSYNGLTNEQKKLYDKMYKVDEVFASYMDKIHEAVPNDLYALQQSSEQISDKMTELEKVISSNGETITKTSQTATTEISKVDKKYSLVADSIQNSLSIATRNIRTEMSNVEKGFSKTADNLRGEAKKATNNISEAFQNKGSGIGEKFGTDIGLGIENGFNQTSGNAINAINNAFSKIKFTTSISSTIASGITLGFKPMQYATGGFPEDGLFYANHNELVGRFANGKTAVVNNDQIISGIRQAAYEGMKQALDENRGSTNVTFEVQSDADNIFKVVQKRANDYAIQAGKSAFLI